MPLYEYACQQCSRRVEKIQKFSDAPLTVCPHCGGTLERTITAPAIQFKGAGWYKDLYSSAKPAAASSGAENAGSGEAKPAGGDSAKGAATPAPAAAPATASTPSSGSSSSGGSAASG